jgi:hypothetical protein
MKHRVKTWAVALSAAALTLATPALAQDETVIIRVEGVGEWVVVNHEVCVTAMGHTVCHRWQTHEFRREQQEEIRRCTTINGEGDC